MSGLHVENVNEDINYRQYGHAAAGMAAFGVRVFQSVIISYRYCFVVKGYFRIASNHVVAAKGWKLSLGTCH